MVQVINFTGTLVCGDNGILMLKKYLVISVSIFLQFLWKNQMKNKYWHPMSSIGKLLDLAVVAEKEG